MTEHKSQIPGPSAHDAHRRVLHNREPARHVPPPDRRHTRRGAIDALPAEIDLVTAVTAAITTTVDHLTGPVLNNYFDANLGLGGMTRLADDLADIGTKRSWQRRFPSGDAFATAMRRFVDCLSWQHTAPGGTRPWRTPD